MPGLDLILVRHGLTDWNEEGRLMGRLPIALNSRGRSQAQAVADALAGLRLRSVFASPQLRAQETAAMIAPRHGLSVQTDEALSEVWLGRWQEKSSSELAADPDVQRFRDDPTHVCDAFEPASAVHERMVGFVESLRPTASESACVLVSHGDPLRILVAHQLGMPLSTYRRLAIDPGSVTILRLHGRGDRVLTLNWSPLGPAALPLSPAAPA
jgi:broad specificity phosphatase PhoE